MILSKCPMDKCPMLNEWTNGQCANALNHCVIDNSLPIVHCSLFIASEGGV